MLSFLNQSESYVLTEDDILKVFSQFGTVLQVKQRSDDYVVVMETYEQAQNALMCLNQFYLHQTNTYLLLSPLNFSQGMVSTPSYF